MYLLLLLLLPCILSRCLPLLPYFYFIIKSSLCFIRLVLIFFVLFPLWLVHFHFFPFSFFKASVSLFFIHP